MNSKYKIIVTTELHEGFELRDVYKKFASVCKIDEEKAYELLSNNKPIVISKNSSLENAKIYHKKLNLLGLKVKVKKIVPGNSNVNDRSKVNDAPNNPSNPKKSTDFNAASRNKIIDDMELASRFTRLIAVLIDGAISSLITVSIMQFFGGVKKYTPGPDYAWGNHIAIVVTGFLIFLIINGKFLKDNGQTIGKKLLGIRIADLDGDVPDFLKSLIPRYTFTTAIAYFPGVMGLLSLIDNLVIFREDKRCIHDFVAKTQVVKNEYQNETELRQSALIILKEHWIVGSEDNIGKFESLVPYVVKLARKNNNSELSKHLCNSSKRMFGIEPDLENCNLVAAKIIEVVKARS